MSTYPQGTVTFLLTDIEGSSRRWEQRPAAMSAALARHDQLLRGAITGNGGMVFRTVGDAFYAAFASASDAASAAVAAQVALAAEPWGDSLGEPGPIRARMGLHTGQAEPQGNDYAGPTLMRSERIMSAGHGGQTLLSLATAELARDGLPAGCELVDLGVHRLKGVRRPEHLFQLTAPDLPRDFPPVRSLDALPSYTTPLLGREGEVGELVALLGRDEVRLVTLTGPGGIGKTRLALRVVNQMLTEFVDGVWLVRLAGVGDPALVAPTVAHALGVRESAGMSPFESLKGYLRDQRALVLLDSFERVAAAGPMLADLLGAAPDIKMVVTSRVVLRVRGEYEYPVEPLSLPGDDPAAPGAGAAESAAVQLFVERARAANPAFEMTAANAPAVAEICRRLEGLPLAIELAAARTRLLPPAALLARLASRLQLLTGGAQDLPERQRTLRGTIAWGHDLLEPDEQVLFRRLSVFNGGFTLEAAEAVTAAGPAGDPALAAVGPPLGLDVLDGLDSLLGHSLLRRVSTADGAEPRFGMLETIREFGLEQLDASGETTALRDIHARYYLELAEQVKPQLRGPDQAEMLARLEDEHANLRAALRWADDRAAVDLVLRMCAALGGFWKVHSHFTEGRSWMDRALALSRDHRTRLRTELLDGALYLSRARGEYDVAEALQREALDVKTQLGDADGVANSLKMLGLLRYDLDDIDGARDLFERSLQARPAGGDQREAAETLNALGVLAHQRSDFDAAMNYLDRSLAAFRRMRDEEGISRLQMNLGNLALDRGDLDTAVKQLQRAIRGFSALGSTWDLVDCFDFLAASLGVQGDTGRSGRIFGAAESLRAAIGAARPEPEQHAYDAYVARARAAGDAQAFSAAWAAGRSMTVEQVVAFALADKDNGQALTPSTDDVSIAP